MIGSFSFHPATRQDEMTLQYLMRDEYTCELSAVSVAIWARAFRFEVAQNRFGFFYRTDYGHGWCYGLPFAADMKAAVTALAEFCREQGHRFNLYGAAGPRFDAFCEACGQDYAVTPARNGYEYLYRTSDLSDLSGKKYHAKRNHVAAFMRRYSWRYEALNEQNIPAVLCMADRWYTCHEADSDRWLTTERNGMNRVLGDPIRYGVVGGVLWVDDRVAAVTFGCPVNEQVFDVNFEKAFTDYNGAYAVINQQFVQHELQGYRYINREDDMGQEGLRKAKLSYHPAFLLEKYRIVERINP